jgi:hypothetical protein
MAKHPDQSLPGQPDRTVTVSVSTQVKPDHPHGGPPGQGKPPDPVEPPEEVIDPPDEIITPPDEIIPPTTGRAVLIYIGTTQHLFTQSDGTDLGAYVDPAGRFTQHCIRATCDTLPAFSVMFRPDDDGTREEVVFELGHIWPAQPPANLGAYTAALLRDGAELARI